MSDNIEVADASDSGGQGAIPAGKEISVTELSDEQLDAQLETALKGEVTEEQETDSDSVEAPDSLETQTEESTPEQEAEEVDETQKAEPQVQVTKAQWDETKRQLEQKELFIQRRNTELGELRKENRKMRDQLAETVNEVAEDNPLEGLKQQQKIEKLDEEEQRLVKEQQLENFIHDTQKVIVQKLEGSNINLEAMYGILEREGARPEALQTVRANPYLMGPDVFVHLAKRAESERLLGGVVNAYKQLKQEYDRLKTTSEGAEKNTIERISKSLKSSPRITATSNGGAVDKKGVFVDPTKLSDEELDEQLAALG